MTAQTFINQCIYFFGDWPTKFKRDEVQKYIQRGYTEKDLDILFPQLQEKYSTAPDIHQIRAVMAPINKVEATILIEPPIKEFTTETAKLWAEDLHDFWERRLPGDSCKNDRSLSPTEKAQMKSRSDAYFNILGKLWRHKIKKVEV